MLANCYGPLRAVDGSYTAISKKVVGKSARDNPERDCGWFWVHCSSKKLERMARETMDTRLQVLKESNKSRFDSYSVRNSVLTISHIAFPDCRVHIFSDNLSRNSCTCSLQTVSIANSPYSEHIRSVHLIITSGHSLLRIVTVRMLHWNGS